MKRKNAIPSIVLVLCLLLPSVPCAAQADTPQLTLDSCLRYALQHNLSVQSALLQHEAAAATLEQARLNFTPTLGASLGKDFSFFGGEVTSNSSYGLGGSWNLFSGTTNLNNYRSAKAGQQLATHTVEQSQNQVSVDIITAYLNILSNNERLSYLQDILSSSGKHAADAKSKMLAGSLLESDYLMLEANWKQAQCEVENARMAIAAEEERLRNLMGIDPSFPLRLAPLTGDDTLWVVFPSLEASVEQALAALPDLKIRQLEVGQADYRLRSAKGGYLPQLNLSTYASYYGGEQLRTNADGMLVTNGGINTTVSLGLNIPIFNRGTNRLQVAQGKIALAQAQLQQEETRRQLIQTVGDCYRTLQQARNNYEAARLMQQARGASLRAYQAKFAAGTVSTVDLLQQQENYLTATNQFIQYKYSYILSQKTLQIYLGK